MDYSSDSFFFNLLMKSNCRRLRELNAFITESGNYTFLIATNQLYSISLLREVKYSSFALVHVFPFLIYPPVIKFVFYFKKLYVFSLELICVLLKCHILLPIMRRWVSPIGL